MQYYNICQLPGIIRRIKDLKITSLDCLDIRHFFPYCLDGYKTVQLDQWTYCSIQSEAPLSAKSNLFMDCTWQYPRGHSSCILHHTITESTIVRGSMIQGEVTISWKKRQADAKYLYFVSKPSSTISLKSENCFKL